MSDIEKAIELAERCLKLDKEFKKLHKIEGNPKVWIAVIILVIKNIASQTVDPKDFIKNFCESLGREI